MKKLQKQILRKIVIAIFQLFRNLFFVDDRVHVYSWDIHAGGIQTLRQQALLAQLEK
mgnify:CR=1 FL=1